MSSGPVVSAFENTRASEYALQAAAWFARGVGAPLVVAHAFDAMDIPAPPVSTMTETSVTGDALVEQARQDAERALALAADDIGDDTDVEPVLVEDAPVRGLLQLAADRDSRALVTGTAARVGVERLLLGSVTAELAARAPCPVIAVPPAAALEEPGPVVAGHDGSGHGLAAARHAAAVAADLGRGLVLVHVAARGDEVSQSDLERACELCGSAPQVDLVHETGKPAEALVRVARDQAAALLFVGTRGRGALGDALLGSVTADVVAAADRPVGLVSSAGSAS